MGRIVLLLFVLSLSLAPGWVGALNAYAETGVVGGGTIAGKVSFAGPLPDDAVENITITKNPEVCGEGNREVTWVDVEGGALRGTFVFLEGIEAGKKWPAPADGGYVIDQRECRFTPWAQVVRPGPLTIRNSDGVLHNINARELIGVEKGRVVKRTMFNLGQPDSGDLVQELKVRRSPYVAINCEAHNFMFGFLMAPEHPYATVVDDQGGFVLEDVPAGNYTLHAWHPRLGLKSSEVTVSSGDEATANFEFTK